MEPQARPGGLVEPAVSRLETGQPAPQDYGALARDRLTIGTYVRASDTVQAMRRRLMLVEAT